MISVSDSAFVEARRISRESARWLAGLPRPAPAAQPRASSQTGKPAAKPRLVVNVEIEALCRRLDEIDAAGGMDAWRTKLLRERFEREWADLARDGIKTFEQFLELEKKIDAAFSGELRGFE